MTPKTRTVALAAGSVMFILLAGSFVPIWTSWHIGLKNESNENGSLRQALDQLPANWRNSESNTALLWKLHWPNVLGVIGLLTLAGFADRAVCRIHQSGLLVWAASLIVGVALAAFLLWAGGPKGELLLPAAIPLCYLFLLLIRPWDSDQAEQSIAEGVIDQLLLKKQQGLIPPFRRRPSRRASSLLNDVPRTEHASGSADLDRLLAIKRRSPYGRTAE